MNIKLEQYILNCVINRTQHSAMSVDTLKNIGYYEYHGIRFKIRIQDAILHILEKTYEPLGFWKQNPHKNSTSENKGVVIENKWDRINTLDTNYSGEDWMFHFGNSADPSKDFNYGNVLLFHKSNVYFGKNRSDSRLTLVSFIKEEGADNKFSQPLSPPTWK